MKKILILLGLIVVTASCHKKTQCEQIENDITRIENSVFEHKMANPYPDANDLVKYKRWAQELKEKEKRYKNLKCK